MTVLRIEGLQVEYLSRTGKVRAVNGVDLALREREAVGLVGESGCGKSTIARTILRLLPPTARVVQGKVELNGIDVLNVEMEKLRQLRWRVASIVPQNALNALNPVLRVGDQIVEVLRSHLGIDRKMAERRVAELFDLVGLPPVRMQDYPHEFSGGMRQRVTIAGALALEPRLVIADEPTTALDVITQRRILDRLKELQRKIGFALLLITHDLSIVRGLCDYIAIMYAGEIVELGTVDDVLTAPNHPYTVGLLSAVTTLDGPRRRLRGIPGDPPGGASLESRCQFADRCPMVAERCWKEKPPLRERFGGTGLVACHRAAEVEGFFGRPLVFR